MTTASTTAQLLAKKANAAKAASPTVPDLSRVRETRTFRATTPRDALNAVKAAFGPDAIIIETREVATGLLGFREIEIVAAPSPDDAGRWRFDPNQTTDPEDTNAAKSRAAVSDENMRKSSLRQSIVSALPTFAAIARRGQQRQQNMQSMIDDGSRYTPDDMAKQADAISMEREALLQAHSNPPVVENKRNTREANRSFWALSEEDFFSGGFGGKPRSKYAEPPDSQTAAVLARHSGVIRSAPSFESNTNAASVVPLRPQPALIAPKAHNSDGESMLLQDLRRAAESVSAPVPAPVSTPMTSPSATPRGAQILPMSHEAPISATVYAVPRDAVTEVPAQSHGDDISTLADVLEIVLPQETSTPASVPALTPVFGGTTTTENSLNHSHAEQNTEGAIDEKALFAALSDFLENNGMWPNLAAGVARDTAAALAGSGLVEESAAALQGIFTDATRCAVGDALEKRVQLGTAPWLTPARDHVAGGTSAPRCIALIGPAGVGKTTTIAKIAARAILESELRVGLITIDTYRVGSVEQLLCYGEIMGLEVHIVRDAAGFDRAREACADCDLVLVDTAGRSLAEVEELGRTVALLRRWPNIELALTLDASNSPRQIERIWQRYQAFAPTLLMLCKSDEADGFASVASCAAAIGRPLVCMTDGQRVPDDMHATPLHKLVDWCLRRQSHG